MNVCAIVSEFSPFHNGHKYLISKLREKNISHVVTIMSGNFTQRGDVAVLSKFGRTKMALLNGVDLVIELPVCFSLSPAQNFAKAALFLIKSMGCVKTLGFGRECESIDKLINVSNKMDLNFDEGIKDILKMGVTFSKARQIFFENLYGKDFSDIISKPNNILAIEYIKALDELNIDLNIESVLREDVQHNDDFGIKNFASSSFIRNAIYNKKDISKYIPQKAYDILMSEIETLKAPCFIENGQRAILSVLRTLTSDDILNIQDVYEGLENRIYKSIRQAGNIEELYLLAKTKRYTLARIRRIVLSSFLGITKDLQNILPPYIRVLGFNNKGSEILKKMKSTATLPIITKYNDTKNLADQNVVKFFNMESIASDLYSLFMPKPLECGQEMKNSVIVLKD